MTKLLINEPPLQVLPTLALKIGLNEAILIQQVHYWIDPRINKNHYNSRYWVYNSYEEWQKQFPFWSIPTIRRAIKTLENSGILISQSSVSNKADRTKGYSIDYDSLDKLFSDRKSNTSYDQNDHIKRSNRTNDPIKMITPTDQNDQLLYKDTENTTENTTLFPKEIEREMIKIWDETINLTKNTTLTNKRAIKLRRFFTSSFHQSLTNWKNFCISIASSKFLMGEVTSFKAGLDWCLDEEVIVKILEGNYGIGDRDIPKKNEKELTDEPDANPISAKAKYGIRNCFGDELYFSWIKPLIFDCIEAGKIVFKAPSKFSSDYINTHLIAELNRALMTNECSMVQMEVRY